jgi:hypothetical protein
MLMINFMLSCESSHDGDAFDIDNIITKASAYIMEIEALEKKADECVDISSAYKFATMAKNLKKEGNQEIQRLFEDLPKPVLIPVEHDLIRRNFVISSAEITSMDLSAIKVEATLRIIDQGGSQPIHVQLCGLNESGVEIHPALDLSGPIRQKNQHVAIVSGILKNPENYTGLVNFKVTDFRKTEN